VRYLFLIAAAVALAGCGKSPLTPEEASFKSLVVVGTPPPVGGSSQFTALALHTDGTSETVTSHVTWTSSNPAVATVSGDGMVTALSRGSVEIDATVASTRGSLTFDVRSAVTFRLTGTVTDTITRAGIAGATVIAKDASGSSKSAVTSSSGTYTIPDVRSGAFTVSVRADGYTAASQSITLVGDLTISFALFRAAGCPVLAFDDLAPHGAPFTSSTACGFTVTTTTSNWTVSTNYGHPAPFVQFVSQGGTTATGELAVTSAGAKFKFQSVDVYSSTTPIPYAITGIANGATVFVLQNTVGNTFGNFATVANPQAATAIDALLIRLSNPAASCCTNPMGIDNIVLAR
jgi:hypothetical protein